MAIVSISLNNTLLEELDRIQQTFGYSGRSEVIRAGARLLIAENKNQEQVSGPITAVLLLIHDQDAEHIVSEIKHHSEECTTTQIHSHLQKNKCLEIFILNGDAQQIKAMVNKFQISGKMEYLKLIIA